MKLDHEKLQMEIDDNKMYLIRLKEWAEKCNLENHKALINKYNSVLQRMKSLQQYSKLQDEKILTLKDNISIHQGVNVDRLHLQNAIASDEIRLQSLKKERIIMEEQVNQLYEKLRRK